MKDDRTVQVTICSACGGSGGDWQEGYGWTMRDCYGCSGFGELLVVGGHQYQRAGNGSVYRDKKGRFASIPKPDATSPPSWVIHLTKPR